MFVNRVLIMSHLTFNVYFKFYLNVCVEVPLLYITNDWYLSMKIKYMCIYKSAVALETILGHPLKCVTDFSEWAEQHSI